MKKLLLVLVSLSLHAQVCEQGLASFKKNVHPILRANCIACHGDDGYAPKHSSSNVEVAYEIAKSSVDFTNVEKSRFMAKVRAKHWLDYDPKEKGIAEEDALKMLQAWRDGGQAECPITTFSYVSAFKKVATTETKVFKTLRFDLSLAPTNLKNTFFEVDFMKNADTRPSFTFKNPRLTSLQNYSLGGVYFMVNGKFNPLENVFSEINAVINGKDFDVKKDSLPGMTLSTRGLVVLDKDNLEETSFAVAFDKLKEVEELPCFAPTAFNDKVKPTLVAKCMSCHQTGAGANRLMLKEENLCEEFSQRINHKTWSRSIFLDYAVKEFAAHPKTFTEVEQKSFLTSVKEWIQSE